FRIPLIHEVKISVGEGNHRLERQPGRPQQLAGKLTTDRIGDIDLTTFESGQPSGLLRDYLHHQPFDTRGPAPVALERIKDQFQARREGDKTIGTGPDWRLLEPVITDLGHVFARYNPRGGTDAGIEGQEVGPRFLQPEPDMMRIRRLDRGDTLL